MKKLSVSVHKFTSCDGCQLAFLNAGESLLILSELVEFVHFAEAGFINPYAKVDIAFIEGSISTPDEEERIKHIRENAAYLIAMGACATAGGIQALRNAVNHEEWMADIYASPKTIETLNTSTAISHHVRVDWDVWGCPVNTHQVMDLVRSLLFGAVPKIKRDSVCLECKRKNQVCVLVAKGDPCMGPVTQVGCGAICPSLNRACYGCYGPSEHPNPVSLGSQFKKNGLSIDKIGRQFSQINNQAPAFSEAANYFKGIKIVRR